MIEHTIWFSMLKLPVWLKLELIEKYNSPEELWLNYFNGNIQDKTLLKMMQNSWNDKRIKEMVECVINENINVACYNDSVYPQKLKLYEDAPSVLYYKGDISKLNSSLGVSIVGSRKCSSYGINAAKIISAELAKNNITVISGLAKGIDGVAHTACLSNRGFTCAVIGSGLDVIYPKENITLFKSLSEEGCIISEFPPGTQPFAYNFPVRNRIISELGQLVIVIEAGIKSGSLITASFALEQGIDVMAVPGSIFSEHSKGCNKLIRDGAYPLTSVEDIFQLLDMDFGKNSDKKESSLNELELKIHNTLSDSPLHIDDIIKLTNIDINYLYEVLFELQLKDEIMCLAGNYYVKNIKNF